MDTKTETTCQMLSTRMDCEQFSAYLRGLIDSETQQTADNNERCALADYRADLCVLIQRIMDGGIDLRLDAVPLPMNVPDLTREQIAASMDEPGRDREFAADWLHATFTPENPRQHHPHRLRVRAAGQLPGNDRFAGG